MFLQNYLYLYCKALLTVLQGNHADKVALNGAATVTLVGRRWRRFFQSIGTRAIVPPSVQLIWNPKKVLELLDHLDTMILSSTALCDILPLKIAYCAWECALTLCLEEFEKFGWGTGAKARCLVFQDGVGNHQVVHSISPLEYCTSLDGAPAMFSDGEVMYMESIGEHVKTAPSLEMVAGFKSAGDIKVVSLRRDECPWATGVTWDLPTIDRLPETEEEWKQACEKVIHDWEEMSLIRSEQ